MADCRECVLRERADGYSVQQVASICKCSVKHVREILREQDPLRELEGLHIYCEHRGGELRPIPCSSEPLFTEEFYGYTYYCCKKGGSDG